MMKNEKSKIEAKEMEKPFGQKSKYTHRNIRDMRILRRNKE